MPSTETVPVNANTMLLQAIALRQCIVATYNRMTVTLAPHILYTRHDEVYVDAVTVDRDGRPPREIKVGTFKLSGLRDISVTDRPFQPEGIFNPKDVKYDGVTLFVVQGD